MIIKKNANILKNTIQKFKFLKLIVVIASLILPTMLIITLIDIRILEFLNITSFLWVGFYSSIFLIYFIDSDFPSFLKLIIIIINIGIIIFALMGSLMGGLQGLLIVTIKMILPFIPTKWISSLVFGIFGYPEP